jgi:hypothetical protein
MGIIHHRIAGIRIGARGGDGYLKPKVRGLLAAPPPLKPVFAPGGHNGRRVASLELAAGTPDHQGATDTRSVAEDPPPERTGAALPSSRASLCAATAIISSTVPQEQQEPSQRRSWLYRFFSGVHS